VSAAAASSGSVRRLGRPPASIGDQTRSRILDAARSCFGDRGYDGTTTRHIAEVAQLTTAAIYHYYPSKSDLYRAAHAQVHRIIYERYHLAIEGCSTLAEEFGAVLATSRDLNQRDPSLARFLVTSRTDERRHPEIALAGDEIPPERGRFHVALVERAMARGEIVDDDAQLVIDTLRTLLAGLVYFASDDLTLQDRVIDGMNRLLGGTLLRASDRPRALVGGTAHRDDAPTAPLR
jgi:AcrR family transcriptional regulator